MNDIKLGNPKYAKKCSYILQDDNLYSAFTVHETMVLAANLKIADMTADEKNIIVSIHQLIPLSMRRGIKRICMKLNEKCCGLCLGFGKSYENAINERCTGAHTHAYMKHCVLITI